MTGAEIAILLQLIQGAIAAAPKFIEIVTAAKNYFMALFNAGLITADVQNALNKHVDDWTAAFVSGNTPPAWTVEPDPAK